MFQSEKILVLAPHTDDGELGCGASISKYIAAGKRVKYIAFSTCSQSLPAHLPQDTLATECRAATKALGINDVVLFDFEVRRLLFHRQEILEELIRINRDWQPDLVLLPAKDDVHQDHQVIHAEGMRAFKNANLFGYELPWNNFGFAPVYFENVTEEQLLSKQKALSHYTSQAGKKYMDDNFIRSLAVVRGVQSNNGLAEAFEVYRLHSR